MTPDNVAFYFDPVCPWTWITSRWLVDVAGRRQLDVTWRSLSLSVVNAGEDVPEQYRGPMRAGERAHRVIAALCADERNDLVEAFYAEWGRRTFHDGAELDEALAAEVAKAVGAEEWADAADDATWDASVESSTREGLDLAGGNDVGSPVLSFGDPPVGIFGPIVSPAPTGDEADSLFDQVVATASMPAFFELKRGRQAPPDLGARP